MDIKSKRNGPKHRVTKISKEGDFDSFPNDIIEAGIVVLFLAGVFLGAYGLYMISKVA